MSDEWLADLEVYVGQTAPEDMHGSRLPSRALDCFHSGQEGEIDVACGLVLLLAKQHGLDVAEDDLAEIVPTIIVGIAIESLSSALALTMCPEESVAGHLVDFIRSYK